MKSSVTTTRKALVALIADNDADTRSMYAFFLRAHGVVAFEAKDGRDAFEKATSLRPNVIVTDITLQALDGFELCRALKGDRRTSAIPVIAVTGYTRPGAEEDARAAGFSAYFLKPCMPDVLLEELTRLAEQHRGAVRKMAALGAPRRLRHDAPAAVGGAIGRLVALVRHPAHSK